MDNNDEVQAYDIVWIHRNILNVRGVDYVFYTAGTEHLLTIPEPLVNTYPDGRNYVLGNLIIDTHRVNPSSPATLVQDLQSQANSIVNQRIDNVELSMNARFLVDRGSKTDRTALSKSVPGGAILTDDLNGVKELKSSDVTRSAYEEQDRLNVDFDDVVGNFSSSSVGSNRQLNETVGGMELMSSGAEAITEYEIRVFAQTWAQPALAQIVKMIQRYETDEKRLAIAGEKAKLYQKFGTDAITDELLRQELTTEIAIGYNATNPQKRIELLTMANSSAAPYIKEGEANRAEIVKELYSAAGFRDGSRFVTIPPRSETEGQEGPSPEQAVAQMEQEQFQMELADNQAERDNNIRLAELNHKTKMDVVDKEREVALIKLATERGLRVDELKAKLLMKHEDIKSDERKVAVDVALKKEDSSYDPGQRLGG